MRSRNRFVGAVLGAAMLALAPAGALAAEDIGESLNISDYSVQQLALPAAIGNGFDVVVTIDGVQQTLALDPYSLRSPGFKVSADVAGVLHPVQLESPRTVRGEVLGVEGSVVAGSLLDEGLKVMVVLPAADGDQQYWIQPVEEPGHGAGAHVVFSANDVLPHEFVCGVDHGGPAAHDHAEHGSISPANPKYRCEIAFDADFVYYGQRGNNVATVVSDIENVMALVDAAYDRDCDIRYEITEIIVRTTSGLYTNPDPSAMLNAFRSQWNTHHGNVQRDVAHLMTGRNLNGSVIGIAWLSVICNLSSAYGLSQTTFTGNMNSRAALTAHELGHNWSAQHCDGSGSCHIMCSGLGGCNGIGNPIRFGTNAKTQITNFRSRRNCLDEIIDNIVELPFFDIFPTGSFNVDLWAEVNGAVLMQPPGAPSAPWAAELDGTDTLVTNPLAAQGAQTPVVVSFHASHFTVDVCETLAVEYRDQNDNWVQFGEIASSGAAMAFTPFSFELPGAALYDGVQIRFRAEGSDGSDDWFIDDVLVEANGVAPPPPGIDLPLFHTFPCDILDENVWAVDLGVAISNEAIGEPSSPWSLKIPTVGIIETGDIRAASYGQSPLYVNFYMQERNVEGGDFLSVSVRKPDNSWTTLGFITAGSVPPGEFGLFEFEIPANAIGDTMALRFQGNGFEADDTWFIDDIGLSEDSLGGGGCDADLDGDGDADVNDFFLYLDLFAAGDPDADLNGDGSIDVNDFFMYLDLFAIGC